MFCQECGTENPEGAVFCKNCGNRLGEHETVNNVDIESAPESSNYTGNASTSSNTGLGILICCCSSAVILAVLGIMLY